MKKQWKRMGALLFAGVVALSGVFGTRTDFVKTLAVSAEENLPIWSLDKITVPAGSGMEADLNYAVRITNAVDTYGLKGAIALPPETAELLEYPYGESDSCWIGDVYPESRFLFNTNLIHEGRIDFSLDTAIPEVPAVSSGTLMEITIAIPAEETVVAVAESYGMPLQEEQGTYFYEFPVNWMEYGYDAGISSGEVISIPRFSYVDAVNQEIFLDQVQLENGYIRVTVSPPKETTTTTAETTTTTEPTTTETSTTTTETTTTSSTTTMETTTTATTSVTTEATTSTESATTTSVTSLESTSTETTTETTTQATTRPTTSTTESTTLTTDSTTLSVSTTTSVTTETTVQESGEIKIEAVSLEVSLEELRANDYQIEIPVRAIVNSGFHQLQFGGVWNPEELTMKRGYGTGNDLLCICNINGQTNNFVWFSFMSLMGYTENDLCCMTFTVSDTAQVGDVYEVQLSYEGSGNNTAGASFNNVPLSIELISSIIKIVGPEETTTTTAQTTVTTTTTTESTEATETTTESTTTTASTTPTMVTTSIDVESTTTSESTDITTTQSTMISTSRTNRTTTSETTESTTVGTTEQTTTTTAETTTTDITTSETTATTSTTVSLVLEVEQPDASQLYVGNSFQLLFHTNASGLVWNSSNHEIATVDANGVVTIHGSGVVYLIAAAQEDLTKTVTIALTIPEPLVTTDFTTTTESETTTTTVETTTETTADTTMTTTSVSTLSTTASTTTESTTTTTTENTDVGEAVLRGDADRNGEIEIADAFQVLLYSSMHSAGDESYTFQENPVIEAEILRQVDIDGDGEIAIADAFYILMYNSRISAGDTDVTWEELFE